jgi:thiol:disulfide interchange protein
MNLTALFFTSSCLLGLFAQLPQEAVQKSPVVDGQAAVTVRLLAEHNTLQTGGNTRIGVHFTLSPGWHIYGANPGGAGFPTAISWDVNGATLTPVVYPPPQMFKESDDIYTYGYTQTALLTSVAQVPQDSVGPVTLVAHVRYLACNIICSPGEVTLRRTLQVGPKSLGASEEVVQAFVGGDQNAAVHKPMAEAHAETLSLCWALALAFVGGLILNLMPCVLPVLALKAMALLTLQHDARSRRAHAAYYGLGVVGSMLLLACGVVGIRAAGHQVGWGFQFQEPQFIAAVALFMLLFACSCFGLFEVAHGVSHVASAHARATGARRSLLEGVLSVAVATPCSAPFLGTAVAFALGQTGLVTALIFVTIGLGLAAPFLALVLMPHLAKRLPRPGPWMQHLKTLLGFFLLATCAWLVWLFGRARNVDDVALLLGLMWMAALAAWAIGRMTAMHPGRQAPLVLLVVMALGGVGHYLWGEAPASPNLSLAQAPYSEALVQAELALGHPVLVDFTADWCITCKYNEHHVLTHRAVRAAMQHHQVTVLRADWTRRDTTILAVLMRYGRAGVPMYLLYTPTDPQNPVLLPEVLSVSTVVKALDAL